MPRPTIINLITFFYPVGNTPAVCFTQDVPPEDDVDILLLGCGDFRSILFTAYADAAPTTRRLDYTCCDIEGAIIARNILAFTLIIDHVDEKQVSNIWQIYYHMYLDDKSTKLLQSQAKKLLSLAQTVESWKEGPYGKSLIFCDGGTFEIVKQLWGEYAISNRSKNEQAKYDNQFKAGIEDAQTKRKALLGTGSVMSGLRSAAPASMSAMRDTPQTFEHFWKHGTTDRRPAKARKDKRVNPTFASRDADTFTLHYGTDPQLGFPLATAYVPLTKTSPLATKEGTQSDFHKITDAARTHFWAWCKTFRASVKNLTLRFFVGDAIAFCHTLQHVAATGNINSNWYRNRYTCQPIELFPEDFGSSGSSPVLFDVIDTSNLLDHLGPLNVLVAASPLLKRKVSSTLYTESLVAQEKNRKDLMDKILCGSFPTMSMLLGLVPVEYWTNATLISNTAETVLDTGSSLINSLEVNRMGQMHCRIVWKTSFPSSQAIDVPGRRLHFRPEDLAILIHRTYQAMFEAENPTKVHSLAIRESMGRLSNPLYHRGSFAAFLKLLQSRVVTQWDQTVEIVIDRIEHDNSIMMSMNYIQDFFTHLYLLDGLNNPFFPLGFQPSDAARFPKGLGSWKDLPPVVCITLEVSQASFQVFKDIPRMQLGTPNVQCRVEGSGGLFSFNSWQEIFADVCLSFGVLTTTGEPTSDDHKVLIQEDPLGWEGTSALLVSFNVPTWVVLRDPPNTNVTFGVQSTPQSTATFFSRLGLGMNVVSAKLYDNKKVHITKHPPHQAGFASVSRLSQELENEDPNPDIRTTILANVDQAAAFISGFTGRLDFQSEKVKGLLLKGSHVGLNQTSPTTISVVVGSREFLVDLCFPVPVIASKSRTRIARTSAYIEVIVPTADHVSGLGHMAFMYPMGLREGVPILANMPYLNLDCLPVIDVNNKNKTKTIGWLSSHASLQLSARERAERDQSHKPNSIVKRDARIDFKDSLHLIFGSFSGLQGKRASVFGLEDVKGGGVQIIIVASRLLLDIANHTVVLDCAVLPLTHEIMADLHPFILKLVKSGICTIRVDGTGMKLWREVLPAIVERCRDWKHLPTCAYKAAGRIPLSTEEVGVPVICSCGNGKFPDGFTGVARWDIARKFATRAAISPTFSVPYVDRAVDIQDLDVDVDGARNPKTMCGKCGNEKGPGGRALSKCARCLAVWYCSPECQRADWREHKRGCRAPE